MEKMTAAHRTLPFETWVRVHNLVNGKSVDVRIQDRGPFIDGRIIDLSHAAAGAIEMVGPGISRVRLTVIAPPKNIEKQSELFAVQVGAFRDRERAESVRNGMQARFGSARLVQRSGEQAIWRVLVGELDTEAAARELAARIEAEGTPAFAVRLDLTQP